MVNKCSTLIQEQQNKPQTQLKHLIWNVIFVSNSELVNDELEVELHIFMFYTLNLPNFVSVFVQRRRNVQIKTIKSDADLNKLSHCEFAAVVINPFNIKTAYKPP